MLILTKNDIQSIFSMQDAIESCKAALSMYSAGETNVPLRTVIDIKDKGQSLFMPAYINQANVIGIKIVSVFPNNIALGKPSLLSKMMLLDGDTGEVCAMLDGTYLTQLRTGALQGAATDILAKKNAKIAAMFGTGGQAYTQLEAMLTVRDLKEVRVFDINFARGQEFVKMMQKEFSKYHTKIIAVKDMLDAIHNADIITAVTTSHTPVFDGDKVTNGAHVNGIGSYLPHMQELPESIITRADKIIFDTNEGVMSEAGDIIQPLNSGALTKNDLTGELGEVLIGKVKGRESDDEITVFKAVGSAVFDVVTAQNIYLKALEMNVGQRIEG